MPTKGVGPFLQVVQVANPAAGAEFTLKAPGQGIWRVMSLAFTLVTSAVVANRRVALLADDQTDVWFAAATTVDLTATLTTRVGAYQGAASTGLAGSVLNVPLPNDGLVLMPGYRLRTSTLNIDAGDQYSAIRAEVIEYPEGPDFEWLPGVFTQVSEMG